MDLNNPISTFRGELKAELARSEKEGRPEKTKKVDFLIWHGAILRSEELLPRSTTVTSPIIALGT